MNDNLLAVALAFVADGLPVFPCEPKGKRPDAKSGAMDIGDFLARGAVR
jgi:hypothetical protein